MLTKTHGKKIYEILSLPSDNRIHCFQLVQVRAIKKDQLKNVIR